MIRFDLVVRIATFVLATAGGIATCSADEVRLFVATPLPQAAQLAVEDLRAALAAHGETVREATAVPQPDEPAIVVGVARESATFDELLREAEVAVSDLAESTAVARSSMRKQTLFVAGSDERGLTYALRDVVRALETASRGTPWSDAFTPAVESPFLRVRNVSLHLFNADCEREWYFSEEYWRFYFARLSLCRFNRCTVTFCDQTNYLCPPYAYLAAMPEYPDVIVADCTADRRSANLAMLRRIAELADEYAIDLDLGIWMQAPVAKWAAPVKVTGLPEGLALADYCALGLRRIYEGCPSLDGIQLRMNAEAGVSEEQQTAFYTPLFQALAAVGRPLRVELRYKGLQDATIDAAVAAGLDVTVSTKFWAEHFGLPYHPTVVDSHYAKDRYSFGTLLKRPRNYRVTYQLWTVGSQRVTLWGDPDYASRFAQSCTLGGGEGFEVFAPLTNKGYGNAPGAWQVIKDPAYRVGRWEQERYWAFYLCFGRMGFNPATNREIWKREFRHRFGGAAEHVESAYLAASQVLPLITAALLPSASEWYWWPEMDTGGSVHEYSRIQTSDPGQLAPVRAWERTPAWRWEDWDARPGFSDRQPDPRTSPERTAERLRALGHETLHWLNLAQYAAPPDHAEWRGTQVDFKLLSHLADYHAAKLQAAEEFVTFESSTMKYSRGQPVARSLAFANRSWQKIVETTDGVYHDDLVFGIAPETQRSKLGHHHCGHWRDRLAELESDRKAVQAMADAAVNERLDSATAFQGNVFGPYDGSFADVRHDPPTIVAQGAETTIRLGGGQSATGAAVTKAFVHVRPLDQTSAWRRIEMTTDANREFVAQLSDDVINPQFDLQYFFELTAEPRQVACWPDWRSTTPYFVVPVKAK